MPEVSVIITTYNYGHLIGESIDSVISQDHDDFELIVVDDGSTDDTAEVVQGYGNRVRYVKQEHLGISEARNHGIALARSELIAFQDADDIWAPDTLSLRVDSVLRHPELGMVFGDAAVVQNGRVITDSFLCDRKVLAALEKSCEEGCLRVITESAFPALLKERFIPIPSIIMPKKRFEEVGMWDSSFDGVEDYEFYLRLARRFRIGYIDKVLVTCRVHGGNVSSSVSAQNHKRIDLLRRFENAPDLGADEKLALRRRLSGLYLESAWTEKSEGNRAASRRDYIRAWSYNHARLGALLRWAMMSVPCLGRARTGQGAADG